MNFHKREISVAKGQGRVGEEGAGGGPAANFELSSAFTIQTDVGWPRIIIFSQHMFKVDISTTKNSPFFQKFKGRVNKVPRLGINAVLLREEFDQEWAVRVGPNSRLPVCPPNYLAREPSVQLFRACPSVQLRKKDSALPQLNHEGKVLQRNPSERLPLIRRAEQSGRETRPSSRLREKMKSQQHKKESELSRKDSAGGEKYRGWKYPPRLSQKALRFFDFVERELATGQKSARI